MSARIRAVLFDVDGTLIDSNDFHIAAWREAFREVGEDVPADSIQAQIGKGGDNLLPALCDPDFVAAHGEALDARRVEIFKTRYMDRVRPFPGVRALFERIAGDGVKIMLASSGSKEEVAHHLDLIECADLVTATASSDDAEHSKPDPDIFAAALAKLGDVTAADALVVGDSPYDMQAAKTLRVRTIGMRCGGFADDVLRAAGADALYDGAADLLVRFETSVLAGGMARAGEGALTRPA